MKLINIKQLSISTKKILILWISILLSIFLNSFAFSATYINNTAVAEYELGTLKKTTNSNLVKAKVCSRAKIELLKYAPNTNNGEENVFTKTYYLDPAGNEYELPSPQPVGSKTGLPVGSALKLVKTEIFHGGEPIFIKIVDDDHNIDPTKQDEITISIQIFNKKDVVYDEETIKFFETDINSGVFVGYIQSSTSSPTNFNGILSVTEDSKIVVSYSDKCGPDDTSTAITVIQAASLVDPFGKIFDSLNGNLLNGVKVTLIDANTNLPVTVYGDDGVSTFPSTVLTGSTVTDSSGVSYVFPDGEYRFPLIPAGNYILKVEPPDGYKWPSIVSDDKLNTLPNGPFTIAIGSRGEVFNIPVDSLPIKIDIPLDPINISALFITKSVNKDIAGWGDFLRYKVTVENISSYNITGVKVFDLLPLGFKYQKGSAKVQGLPTADPIISSDGRTLEFVVGSLASNGKAEITYVVEVGVSAKLGPAKNIANAKGDGGITSNTAKAEVIVRDDFMQSKSFIIGKVMVGCDVKQPEPEIKIEKEEVIDKVELKGRITSELMSELSKKDNGYEIDYNLSIEASLAIKDVRAVVTIPEGLTYKKGSSIFGDSAIEPEVDGALLKFKLGDLRTGEKTSLKFALQLSERAKEGNLDTKVSVVFNSDSDTDLKSEPMAVSYKLDGKREIATIPPILIRPKFESGSAILTDDDKLKLDDLIAQLKGYKIKSLEVIGHTDNQRIGRRIKNIYPDNYALSKARAESVANYLMRFLDLSSAEIKTSGKGEDEPLRPNNNPFNMSLNRRVELNITAEKITEIKSIEPVGDKSIKNIKEFTVIKTEKREVEKEVVKKPSKRYKELPKFGDGLEGVKIYMEDGTYVVTDKNGMYHFEGVKPGTHVLQIDKKTVPENYEIILYEDNTRFAGTPYSRFVDLQGGTLWRADFYVCPTPVEEKEEEPKTAESKKDSPKKVTKVLNGVVKAELTSTISENKNGQEISYKLPLETGEVPVKNIRVSIILPKGIVYKKGSSRFGEKELEPEVIENALSYSLRNLPANSKGELIFSGEIVKNAIEDEMITRGLVIFDTDTEKNLKTEMLDTIYKLNSKAETTTIPPILIRPKFESGSAILTEEDKLKLDDLITQLKGYKIKRIEVIGHTDNQRINGKLKNIYPDNYALSKARAESVANYLTRFLDLSYAILTISGKGEDDPLVSNSSAENMALNRRVEINITAEKLNDLTKIEPVKERSGVKEKTFTITKEEELVVKSAKPEKKEVSKGNDPKSIDDLTQEWIDKQRPGFEFIFPKDGYYPPLPSLDIAVKYFPTSKIKLFLNGKEVEGIFLDSTKKSSSLLTAITNWAGVHLIEGDNILEAVEYDSAGKETSRIKKIVHYSGPPVRAEVIYEKSKLIADGKNPIVVAIKLLDKDGHPAREGVVGEYKVLPPHLPLKTVTDFQLDPLTKSNNEMSKYLVKEDGLAFIELNPTSQTGEAILKFNLVSGEKEIRVWIKPEKRDWILVGLAEGTLGYNGSSGNKLNLSGSGIEDGFSRDGRVAFFAKGMLGDEWLLTLSYDSDRTGSLSNNKLFNTIDPAKYYTLYGDTSQQQYEAQSSKPLYVKLERDKFYALFGDFQTNLNATELARYNRSFTGIKSELKDNKYELNLFITDTNQAYVKDELRGDGTSGLYKLSAKNIVINSEKITLETRDRFKSEIKVSTKQLARFIDYNIDYDTGTIFFKSPVTPFDENLNPIYIIVEYEVFDTSKTVLNYGGRGSVKLWDKKLEIGASYIHEEAIGKKGELFGVDVKANITEKTTIKAEIAETNVDNGSANLSALAYLAELSHTSDKLRGKIYFRELEKDFGLGQQSASESGTRKMGVMGSYNLTQNLEIGTDLMRQYNLNDNTRRDLAELKSTYRDKRYDLTLGLRHAQDTLANGDTYTSEQLLAGGAVRLLEDKLTLKVQRDQSVSGNKNADFPTRTMLGADYKLNDKVMLFASHEMLDGKTVETDISRIGMKSTPWQGGQINSTIEQQHTENGVRVFSVFGLQQTWQVNEKWSLSAGLDRSDTIKKASYTLNGNTFSAGNESDYTAVNFSAGYKEKLWGWNGRVEYRDGKEQDKAGLFSSIYGEIKEGIGIGTALQLFDTKSHTTEQIFADLRFGLVYRPKLSKWTLLERLDIILDSLRGGENAYDSLRFVNIANLNYKDSKKWQFSIQYGAKYVTESIDDKDYSGFTDLIGFEGRYDVKNNWDIGLRAKLLHSWNAGQYKYSFGPTIGYTPKKNIWISLGYNLTGFTDRDFSKADYTAHGIFFNFRIKFDQESAKNSIRWLIGSPSN